MPWLENERRRGENLDKGHTWTVDLDPTPTKQGV
jgi:hypothetical protein